MIRLQRANDRVEFPTFEDSRDEINSRALWEDHSLRRSAFGQRVELLESPALFRREIAQRVLCRKFAHHFAPSVVKHLPVCYRNRTLRGKLLKKSSLLPLLIFALATGCATSSDHSFSRPFKFGEDTFSYANELVWEYEFDDATGATTHRKRVPEPSYTHHCFVVARAAKQFFQNARFDPSAPKADAETYRKLVQRVVSVAPRRVLPEDRKVVVPGYSNLFTFSQDWGHVLKAECGGAWRSYFQKGHWRMMFPLTRAHQDRMSQQLLDALGRNRPAVVHVVRFPKLTINHSLVIFDATERNGVIEFAAYDPNHPEKPSALTFDPGTRRFHLPRNPYFIGGRVDVYEIYHAWNY